MSNSFVNRILRASLVLPQGNFPGTSSNTLVLEGYRMSATISGAVKYPSTLELRVYGMRQADMQALTVVWTPPAYAAPDAASNQVPTAINARALCIVEALTGSQWLQIFEGGFTWGAADYSGMPQVAMAITCKTGFGAQIMAAAPQSFKGAASVAQLAAQLAGQMGFAFQNAGVSGVLSSPYFAGTLMDQFNQLADAAPFDYYLEGSTLVICPPSTPQQNQPVVVLSAQSGLIGYPTIEQYGISCQCLFDPAIRLGAPVQIMGSAVPGTDGLWFPYSAEHTLESVTPGGAWFSSLKCSPCPGVSG